MQRHIIWSPCIQWKYISISKCSVLTSLSQNMASAIAAWRVSHRPNYSHSLPADRHTGTNAVVHCMQSRLVDVASTRRDALVQYSTAANKVQCEHSHVSSLCIRRLQRSVTSHQRISVGHIGKWNTCQTVWLVPDLFLTILRLARAVLYGTGLYIRARSVAVGLSRYHKMK